MLLSLFLFTRTAVLHNRMCCEPFTSIPCVLQIPCLEVVCGILSLIPSCSLNTFPLWSTSGCYRIWRKETARNNTMIFVSLLLLILYFLSCRDVWLIPRRPCSPYKHKKLNSMTTHCSNRKKKKVNVQFSFKTFKNISIKNIFEIC